MGKISYIVKLNQSRINSDELGFMFNKTCCHKLFCGELVNQNGVNFYFELENSGALVIIPHTWIDWMAPKKIETTLEDEDGTDNSN
jgi:hypothetical protein